MARESKSWFVRYFVLSSVTLPAGKDTRNVEITSLIGASCGFGAAMTGEHTECAASDTNDWAVARELGEDYGLEVHALVQATSHYWYHNRLATKLPTTSR